MDPQIPKQTSSDMSGDRPTIRKAGTASKYRPGDKVLLSKAGVNVLDGPYLIEKTVSPGKYTLADEKGHKMNEGKVVGDEDLQRA